MLPDANIDGDCEPDFARVRDAFADVVRHQPGTGASVAIWQDGRYVVDLWGGWADAARTKPWHRESIVMPYSVSKPFAAVCALLLVERGMLDLDARVSRYWPEFTSAATVRHVLSHQAGIVALDDPLPAMAFADWDLLCGRLAGQEPAWAPGTAHGEAALFYGHLVGEIVRRVDGRRLGRFLSDEVTAPGGLDFCFGVAPDDLERVVDLTGLGSKFIAAQTEGRPALYGRAVSNPAGAFDGSVVNSSWWRSAEVPAINGHGTARAIAGFYAALAHGQVLQRSTLELATSVATAGVDQVFGFDNAWGLGFAIDPDGFGMGGSGGNLGWWSTAGSYAFAFVTGSAGDHDRSDVVEGALRDVLGLDPL